MHLKKSISLIVAASILPMFLNANDESILSKDRLDLFNYSKQQNEQSSAKLKKDWINPINLTYSKNYGQTADIEKSVITITQPIFKSGGIYNAIKYANATFEYNDVDIDIQKKELIKNAATMLFNLNILDLNIKKNELLLRNAKIDIIRKKEQVLNGFLDTSYLDNAILSANTIKNAIADLKYQKNELNNSFLNISSASYDSFELPKLSMVDKANFMKNSLELIKAKNDTNKKDYYTNMTISKYLPTVNATFDYTKYHDIDGTSSLQGTDHVQNYGFNVTIPLDIRTFNDIETQRIDYLKAKLSLKNTELEEENYFKTKVAKIDMIQEKLKIAKDDFRLYDSLLKIIIEEKNAELKTQSDVETLQNSQKIKSLEAKIYKLQEQIELLDIYSKIAS